MLEIPDSVLFPVVSWLLNYALHSTLLIGAALLITKLIPERSARVREVLLTLALLGGIVTATIQLETNSSAWVVRQGSVKSLVRFAGEATASDAESRDAEAVLPANMDPDVLAPAVAQQEVSWVDMLAISWLAGVVILGAVYLAKWWFFLKDLEERRPVENRPLLELLEEVKHRAGMRRDIRLSISERTSNLMAIGFSEICLPERLLDDLEEDEIRSILAHELAHLWRFDPLRLIVMSVISILFFLQPLNLVAARKLRAEAEFLADEWAVSQTGKPTSMASSLLKAAMAQRPCHLAPATAGMAGIGASLVDRTKRILGNPPGDESAFPRCLTLAAIAAFLAVIAFTPRMADRLSTDPNSDAYLRFAEMQKEFPTMRERFGNLPTSPDFPESPAVAPTEGDSSDQLFENLGIDKENGTHFSALTRSGHVNGVHVEADVSNVTFDTRKEWIYKFVEGKGFLLVSYRREGVRYRFEVYKSRTTGWIDRRFFVDDTERTFDDDTELLLKHALIEMLYLARAPEETHPLLP